MPAQFVDTCRTTKSTGAATAGRAGRPRVLQSSGFRTEHNAMPSVIISVSGQTLKVSFQPQFSALAEIPRSARDFGTRWLWPDCDSGWQGSAGDGMDSDVPWV